MFIVTVSNSGIKFFLRGTTWAYYRDRGIEFQSRAEAQIALEKARKFMKPSQFKLAVIEEVLS